MLRTQNLGKRVRLFLLMFSCWWTPVVSSLPEWDGNQERCRRLLVRLVHRKCVSCTKDAYRNILYAERPSHAQFLSGKTTVDSSSGYAELCAPETASVWWLTSWRFRCAHIRTPKSRRPQYRAFYRCSGLPGAGNHAHLKRHWPDSQRISLPGVNMFAHLSVRDIS